MSLDFLKQIKVEDPSIMKKPSGGGGGRRKEWNPTLPNSIRVWKDGKVFPSADLVERFSLEYGNKPGEKEKASGYAIDVFASKDFPIFQTPTPLVLANITLRAAGKTDLFGSTGYNEDGSPMQSVLEQGAATFGKSTLIPMLEEVYGLKFNRAELKATEGADAQPAITDGIDYADLILLGTDGEDATQPFALPQGKNICHVPKEIARGEKKGEMTYTRRENPVLYALYPYLLIHPVTVTELADDTKVQQEEDAKLFVHDKNLATI